MHGFDHRQARPMTSRLMDMMDSGEIDVREVADMALGWLSEDSVKLMMQANDVSTLDDQDDEEEDNPLRRLYDNCMCPDCGEGIPQDAEEGGQCSNCDHVWGEGFFDDDEADGQPDEAQEWHDYDHDC